MMTVHQVSKLTGISVRTLQYYDSIGLLPPAGHTEAGYRLYDDAALERLQQILLFRELEFSLKDIRLILQNPAFDRTKALEQQIALLTLKKEHLENLIAFARGLQQQAGGHTMEFTAFDTGKTKEYAAKAKQQWQHTDAYREFAKKSERRAPETETALALGLMDIFRDFGKQREHSPASEEAQALVKRLQSYISEHYYRCTPEILKGLGVMYVSDDAFRENIDKAGGDGTADFVNRAISAYCD